MHKSSNNHSGLCQLQYGELYDTNTILISNLTYVVSVWAYVEAANSNIEWLVHDAHNEHYRPSQVFGNNNAVGEWQLLSVRFTASETRKARLHFIRGDSGHPQSTCGQPAHSTSDHACGEGSVFWDDVSITPLS